MRPLTSPDMGDSGGSPWRRPKLALRDGESLVFCESLLLGVILRCIRQFQSLNGPLSIWQRLFRSAAFLWECSQADDMML